MSATIYGSESEFGPIIDRPYSSDVSNEPGAHRWTAALAATSIAAFALALLLEDERWVLSASCFGSLALSCLIYMATRYLAPDLALPRLIVLIYALQIFWSLLIAVLDLPTIAPYNRIAPDLLEHPFGSILPLLTVPLGVLALMAIIRLFRISRSGKTSVLELLNSTPRDLRFYLIFAALLQLCYWPAAMEETGAFGYAIRAFSHAMIFVPFIAGRVSKKFPWVHRIWLGAMAVNAAIGLSVGARGVALIPPALYMIGMIGSLQKRARIRLIALTAAAAIPVFLLSGAVGAVRDRVGRGGLEILNAERVYTVFDAVSDAFNDSQSSSQNRIAAQGISRMLMWTNVTVPVLTPSKVPYRGFEGFEAEIAATAQIAAVTGASREDFYAAGLAAAPANDYGFLVNEGNSVEFGILPDGWSRGGFATALLFAIVFAAAMTGTELFIRSIWKIAPSAAILLFAVCARCVFEGGESPLLASLRSLVLKLSMFLVFVGIVYLFSRRSYGILTAENPERVF